MAARKAQTQPPQPAQPQLISLTDAGTVLGVHPRTLRRYISDGLITGHRVGPRLIKVDRADLDQLTRPIPTAKSRPAGAA